MIFLHLSCPLGRLYFQANTWSNKEKEKIVFSLKCLGTNLIIIPPSGTASNCSGYQRMSRRAGLCTLRRSYLFIFLNSLLSEQKQWPRSLLGNWLTDVLMVGGPTLDRRGQQGVAEAESSHGERCSRGWVDLRVVPCKVPLGKRRNEEAITLNNFLIYWKWTHTITVFLIRLIDGGR